MWRALNLTQLSQLSGISVSVWRYWCRHGLKPHLVWLGEDLRPSGVLITPHLEDELRVLRAKSVRQVA